VTYDTANNGPSSTAHTQNRYDLIAPLYDVMEWPVERWLYDDWRRQLWAEVRGPDVLELGVGTGKNISYYPNNVSVEAVDLSEKMLSRARKLAEAHPEKQIVLRQMDAQQLTYPDDTFDEVVATFVFCSIPDPVRGLREARRVTRAGGRLHLLEHVRASSPPLARIMNALDPVVHWGTGVHIARETTRNVEKAGWQIDRVTPLTRGDIFLRIEASARD
jgi:ubiquinone/menaquinone biosynthesis C-methylase UbiE